MVRDLTVHGVDEVAPLPPSPALPCSASVVDYVPSEALFRDLTVHGALAVALAQAQIADVVTASAVATPSDAAEGTSRLLTVTGNSSTGSPLIFDAPVVAGITFTPVSGQPNQWTFIY
jgi:hypothetical protein